MCSDLYVVDFDVTPAAAATLAVWVKFSSGSLPSLTPSLHAVDLILSECNPEPQPDRG